MFLSKKDKALLEKVIELIETDTDKWETYADYYYTPPMILSADYDLKDRGYKICVRKNPGPFLDYEVVVLFGTERIYRIKQSNRPVFFGLRKKLIKAIRNNFVIKRKKNKEDEFFESHVWYNNEKTVE